MTLRWKVLFIIAATFAVLIAAVYLASRTILLDGILAMEQSLGRRDVERCTAFIRQELAHMDRLANDYASWNDTYEYVADPAGHREYIRANMIDTTFENLKLNLLIIVDREGRIVFGRGYDLREKREMPVPPAIGPHLREGTPLFLAGGALDGRFGVILLPAAPLLVAARPILPSDETGPARGTLVMGRYFNAAGSKPHDEYLDAPIEARRADDADLPEEFRRAARRLAGRISVFVEPVSEEYLAGYAVQRDLYGEPAIYLKLLLRRAVYHEGRKAVAWFISALVGVGLVIGAAIAVLLQRQVLSRLIRLSRALAGIEASRDPSARVPASGNDEIAALARDINGMLESLEESRRELAESEFRYRSIVENTRDVIMLTRPDGTISYISPACREVLGYTQEDLTDCRPSFTHPGDETRVRRILDQAMAGERGSGFEYRVVTKDGAVKRISHSWSPILSGGRIGTLVNVIRDITERCRMEEELSKAHKLETVGVLAGGIAHDFNNILTAIWGYLSLAKAAVRSSSEATELLVEAEKAAARARDLTQQLLTFSRGGAPVRRALPLEPLLRDSAGFALSGSNVTCEMSLPETLWPVEADEGQLHQVVNNLVLNAVQSMPQGGRIRIAARNVRAGSVQGLKLPGRDYVIFSVRDEGIGIPAEHLGKIFDPYFSTKQRGSGLGLSISYSIVKKHDGMIRADSTLGEGTTFSVYLPAAEEAASQDAPGEREPPRGTGRILLMDDDDDVRAVAGRMLEHFGYGVVPARDGEEALALYAAAKGDGTPFDAAVMDLTISGGMGGKEAMERLRALDPSARAIASSGYSNDPVAADYAAYGFSGFVPKPYRIEQLTAELARILSGGGEG